MSAAGDAFRVVWLSAARDDFLSLAPNVRPIVAKGIAKVAQNPLPQARGGYGKPLGRGLAGLFKIKFRAAGIRVVYALREVCGEMLIVVVAARENGEAYRLAEIRRRKSGC